MTSCAGYNISLVIIRTTYKNFTIICSLLSRLNFFVYNDHNFYTVILSYFNVRHICWANNTYHCSYCLPSPLLKSVEEYSIMKGYFLSFRKTIIMIRIQYILFHLIIQTIKTDNVNSILFFTNFWWSHFYGILRVSFHIT